MTPKKPTKPKATVAEQSFDDWGSALTHAKKLRKQGAISKEDYDRIEQQAAQEGKGPAQS